MKRFIAVFQVRLPNGDEGRKFTTIFADDLKHALDKWATTSKTGEFLISIQHQPSMQEFLDSVPALNTPAD